MTHVMQGSPLLSLAWQSPTSDLPHLVPPFRSQPWSTFPRQTPGWTERKGHFHLELCLSWALRRSKSPLFPKGSCEQTPPKNEYTGIRRWDKPLQETVLRAGVGATCWAQVRHASTAHRLGPSGGGCAQNLPPEARGHSSPPLLLQVTQNSHFPCFSKT